MEKSPAQKQMEKNRQELDKSFDPVGSFEEESRVLQDVDPDQMKELSTKAAEVEYMESRISCLEEDLKEAKKGLEKLIIITIPEMMDEMGVASFTTNDGKKVDVKPMVFASIKKDNQLTAHTWLKAHGYEGLIKSSMSLTFPKGESHIRDLLLKELTERKLPAKFSAKDEVHFQTLSAWVRECDEQGKAIPEETFGIFRFRKAVISTK